MKRTLMLFPLLILVGCGTPEAKSYKVVGVVRKVEADDDRITIAHEDIPGFMPAMTMPFHVEKTQKLEEVHEGDKVEATLKVGSVRSELTDLKVVEVAAPPAMKLTMRDGQMELRPVVSRLTPGEMVPDFAMTDQDGNAIKLSDFRGKVVVLTFIYTRCPLPEYCPKMDTHFSELAKMVGAVKERADRVRLLSVSFDPEHDSPEVLKAHAKLRGANPPLWRFAVASHEELQKVGESLGLVYGPRPNEIMHNLTTAVIGPDGKLARLVSGGDWKPAELYQAARKLLND